MASETPTGPALLVVEDNDRARAALTAILRMKGFAVTPAADGRQALNLLANGLAPNLILLDMLMPVLDGWHFLRELQAQTQQVPVLVVTGTILTREWARDHGCAGLVRKPVEPDALVEEIRRCLV
jgi:CheY-like chemotaxis protein